MTKYSIPIVDLQDFFAADSRQQNKFVDDVGKSLRDIGFFALTGHGISETEINSTYEIIDEFFKLSEDVKNKYSGTAGGQRGYTPFGVEHAKNHDAPDLKEFWHVGREFAQGDENADRYPPNVWPDEMPKFKEHMLGVYNKLEQCSDSILQACAMFLGEEKNLFSSMSKGGDTVHRLIHYPPVPEDVNPSSVRAAAHEDINFITLLIDATDSGLELLTREGEWMPVVTPPQCIIVDSGDMIQNITAGYFRSTTHRVVNPDNSRERRYSMPFFVHPRHEVSLKPLSKCVDLVGGDGGHQDISAGDFLRLRLKEIGLIT